jgi:hypothetical protein
MAVAFFLVFLYISANNRVQRTRLAAAGRDLFYQPEKCLKLYVPRRPEVSDSDPGQRASFPKSKRVLLAIGTAPRCHG